MHGTQDVTDQATTLQARLAEIHQRLWYWTNPDNVTDFGLIMQMEDSLEKSLGQIQREKENFQKRRRLSIENELKDSIQLPFQASSAQQLQSLLWTPSEHMALTQEPKLHTQRDIESCTGSTSGSYFGCPSTSSKSEANSPGQLSGIDNIGQDAYQGLQFGGMYSYLPYGLNMPSDNSHLQAIFSLDQRQSTLAYDAGRNYQPTLSCHDVTNHFPAEFAFGDFSNYQKSAVPAPVMPSVYEGMTRDSSHLIFDNTHI